jgi:hypothetical protein
MGHMKDPKAVTIARELLRRLGPDAVDSHVQERDPPRREERQPPPPPRG